MQADAARGFAIDLDRETGLVVAAQQMRDVAQRIRLCVWMREAIAQVFPDAPVVAVARQARRVLGPEGPHDALARSQVDHRARSSRSVTIGRGGRGSPPRCDAALN